MPSRKHCHDGRNVDFLGIECAWPATDCFATESARQKRRVWARRLGVLASAAATFVGVWHLIA